MKNIHLVPTKNQYKGSISLTPDGRLSTNVLIGIPYNLYITNSEEIKEGDWCLNVSKNLLYKKNKVPMDIMWRKIILTTDQDLIKDGVQSIDDDFLEWFIENPSCESVKLTDSKTVKEHIWDGSNDGEIIWEKEIIIPQEEPYDRTYQPIILSDIDKEEPKIGYVKSETEFLGVEFTLKDGSKQFVPKQEKLEEAAERLYPINSTGGSMEMLSRYQLNNNLKQEGFIKGAKWQQERMYSEEDFKLFARQFYREIKLDKSNLLWDELADKCFEQFKKR
jgi:hypothetical protein